MYLGFGLSFPKCSHIASRWVKPMSHTTGKVKVIARQSSSGDKSQEETELYLFDQYAYKLIYIML